MAKNIAAKFKKIGNYLKLASRTRQDILTLQVLTAKRKRTVILNHFSDHADLFFILQKRRINI